jgi:hypothetical protein
MMIKVNIKIKFYGKKLKLKKKTIQNKIYNNQKIKD